MERPPPRTHATLDELIDDPPASPARKVLAILGILALLDGWLTYQFGFQSNGPPPWVVLSLIVVLNVLVLVFYVWRFQWAVHVDSSRRNPPASPPPNQEPAAGSSEAAPTDAIRSADDSVRRP